MNSGEWVADLEGLKCRNVLNGVVVAFQRSGKFFDGKVEYIPDGLMAEWANGPKRAREIEKAVMEAEEVFMTAFFENDINTNGIREEWMKK